MDNIGVYIHIPFCKSKCAYCDFVSFTGENADKYYAYKNALVKEIENAPPGGFLIKSVYFGSGTPTIFPARYILDILETIGKYNLSKDAEITIEANPGTASESDFADLKKGEVNRISFGLQSADDDVLAFLGRTHARRDFLRSYEAALRAGFTNIGADIIFAIPGKTRKPLEFTLDFLLGLALSHISAYALTIEAGTRFENLKPADEKTDREEYYLIRDTLQKNGFTRYEISNFAKPGKECAHNQNYWNRGEYLGYGVAAHSFARGSRFANTKSLENYLNGTTEIERRFISREEAAEEKIFLGLRSAEGVDKNGLEKYLGKIAEAVRMGFLSETGGRIRLTDKGIDVSNAVFEFILL